MASYVPMIANSDRRFGRGVTPQTQKNLRVPGKAFLRTVFILQHVDAIQSSIVHWFHIMVSEAVRDLCI